MRSKVEDEGRHAEGCPFYRPVVRRAHVFSFALSGRGSWRRRTANLPKFSTLNSKYSRTSYEMSYRKRYSVIRSLCRRSATRSIKFPRKIESKSPGIYILLGSDLNLFVSRFQQKDLQNFENNVTICLVGIILRYQDEYVEVNVARLCINDLSSSYAARDKIRYVSSNTFLLPLFSIVPAATIRFNLHLR